MYPFFVQLQSLFFANPRVEKDYRTNAWKGTKTPAKRYGGGQPAVEDVKTLSPSVFNAYFDILVVLIVFFIICLDCFLSYKPTMSWILYFCLATLFLMTVIFVLAKNANVHYDSKQQSELFGLKPSKPLVRKVSPFSFLFFFFEKKNCVVDAKTKLNLLGTYLILIFDNNLFRPFCSIIVISVFNVHYFGLIVTTTYVKDLSVSCVIDI